MSQTPLTVEILAAAIEATNARYQHCAPHLPQYFSTLAAYLHKALREAAKRERAR